MVLMFTDQQIRKQARQPRSYASSKLQLNDRLTDSLTGVKCRATSVARNGLFACLGLALIGLVTLVAVTLDAARNSRLQFRPELAEPFKV